MSVEIGQVTAVVLAGGFGTRVRHLLPELPKPMAPVAGKPFLEWVIRYLAAQGLKRVVISTGYRSEVVAQHFQAAPVAGVHVTCVAELEPLGTAGGFLHAARASGEQPPAWLVLNGDSLVFADLGLVVGEFARPACAGVVIGRSVPDASRYGSLVVGPENELLRFEEKRPGAGLINSGIYCLRHTLLKEFPGESPLSFEKDVFPVTTARGARLKVISTEAPFLDIGTPETLPQAESFIRQNLHFFARD